jgi:hypothetical protein
MHFSYFWVSICNLRKAYQKAFPSGEGLLKDLFSDFADWNLLLFFIYKLQTVTSPEFIIARALRLVVIFVIFVFYIKKTEDFHSCCVFFGYKITP